MIGYPLDTRFDNYKGITTSQKIIKSKLPEFMPFNYILIVETKFRPLLCLAKFYSYFFRQWPISSVEAVGRSIFRLLEFS